MTLHSQPAPTGSVTFPAEAPAKPARVADSLAATLYAHGVRAAFTVPGGEVVTLLDALDRAGIAVHLARQETAAAIMAAGHAALTGAPGLLVTTLGPGLAQAVNGVADAAQERAPLLVISGAVDRATRARYTHQVIDHAALLRPLVKASFEVEAEGASATLARALTLALAAPMGPVHLDLAPGVAAMPATDAAVPPVRELRPGLAADDPAVGEVAARLAAAERPVILAGFEAARAGADVARLAEALGAPVLTTYKAKGVIAEDHPLALGAAGLSPAADALLLPLLARADLVLALGYDPIEMRLGWLDPADPARLIEVTAAPADHGMHRAGLRLRADPAEAAAALARAAPRPRWPGGEPPAVRDALAARFAAPRAWGPHAIVAELNAAAGADAIVIVDSGAHRILLSQIWRAARPMTLLQSAGFCTMAAALPLAIGAAIARPGARVLAVMGDGGLEMAAGELATLRDLGHPVTVVVFQDESLALIALKQAQAGLAPLATRLGRTDLAALARAFGGRGVTVEDADALRATLAEAADWPGFTLIACRFDADDYRDAF